MESIEGYIAQDIYIEFSTLTLPKRNLIINQKRIKKKSIEQNKLSELL